MQRWCWRLRSLAATLGSSTRLHHHHHHPFAAARLLHTSPNLFHKPPIINRSLFAPNYSSHISISAFPSPTSQSPFSLIQVRYITLKQRKRKLKSRQPISPVVSKLKKYKLKGYSSYKGRFRLMHDGQIRRWKEGKRHNAFSKSKKSKRRLRLPGVVPAAFAKTMKKLGFGA